MDRSLGTYEKNRPHRRGAWVTICRQEVRFATVFLSTTVLWTIVRLWKVGVDRNTDADVKPWRIESATPCSKIFIDLGSNDGESIQAFLHPDGADPRHPLPPRISSGKLIMHVRHLGWNVSDFCIYGFEGNPRFTEILGQVEKRESRFARVVQIFKETVVGVHNGEVKLYLDDVNEQHQFWGSSVMRDHESVLRSSGNFTNVISVDFADFLEELLLLESRKEQKPFVVVKMDIEGSEYEILRHLAVRGLLCLTMDYLFLEFHDHAFPRRRDEFLAMEKTYTTILRSDECRTSLITDGMRTEHGIRVPTSRGRGVSKLKPL